MYVTLQVVTAMLSAITMALALAHALELPGKMRLDKDEYMTVQPIYYPGFTIGGFAEVGAIVAAAALLFFTPAGAEPFWLIAAALALLVTTHLIFWLMTQPVNKFWLEDTELSSSATSFFGKAKDGETPDWTVLRDRWERSHVLRAVASFLGLTLLLIAMARH